MAKVRSLESRVRNGALLAGIPLLLTAVVPYSLDPLVFSWKVAREADQLAPLIAPAAGLMIVAVGLVPGLPRLARGLMMLIFAGVAGYFFVDLITGLDLGPRELRISSSTLTEPRVLILLGTIAAAAVSEFMVQAKKVAKAFAFLALLGWGGFLANYFIPVAGEMPLIAMIDFISNDPNLEGPVLVGFTLLCIFLLLGFFGVLFALLRLIRSQEGMLRGPWRSSWSGALMAGSLGWVLLVVVASGMIAEEKFDYLPLVFNGSAILWGIGVGLTAGLAHTFLGFTASAPTPARGFQPQPVAPPPAGSKATLMDGSPAVQPYSPPAMQPSPPQVQTVPAPQAAPTIEPAPVAPAQPQLEPYPGYPGYFICPNNACRGGVGPQDAVCPHCQQQIR